MKNFVSIRTNLFLSFIVIYKSYCIGIDWNNFEFRFYRFVDRYEKIVSIEKIVEFRWYRNNKDKLLAKKKYS